MKFVESLHPNLKITTPADLALAEALLKINIMSKATYEWRQIPNGPRLAVATVADSECAALTIHVPGGQPR